jgi:3-isopropylmalate/(R)-2-methylmalate dehydratase large subunit
MHAIEKILARASGKERVRAGEIVSARVDFAEVNDLYLQTIYSFYEMGGKRVWDREKLCFVFDHYAPAPTVQSAEIHKKMREFVGAQDLRYHFDVNAGVCHQVMPEAGCVYPGMVLIATDSHTTTHGAFGAFGTGVGATDMATIMISGALWLRVPEIVEIRLEGKAPPCVLPKDVILHVLGRLHADGAVYQAVHFTGDYTDALDVAGRMTLCNMAVELGAKTAYMQPNLAVLDYVAGRTGRSFTAPESDPDFQFARSHVFDVSALSPQIALPFSVDNVVPVEEVGRVKIHQGFIGACTGGRLEDIRAAAAVLRGKTLPREVRLVVIPASAEILRESIARGYFQALSEAGAVLTAPGCGPCLGVHQGCIAGGEVCITASNRNFPGRMGSAGGEIYLASPLTVAVSALRGEITDPRTVGPDTPGNLQTEG